MPDDQTQIDLLQYATPNQLAAQRLDAQKLLEGGMSAAPVSGGALNPFAVLAGLLQTLAGRHQSRRGSPAGRSSVMQQPGLLLPQYPPMEATQINLLAHSAWRRPVPLPKGLVESINCCLPLPRTKAQVPILS